MLGAPLNKQLNGAADWALTPLPQFADTGDSDEFLGATCTFRMRDEWML